MQVYTHPTCSTCKRALKWLDTHHIAYQSVDIRQQAPSSEFFIQQVEKGVPLTKMMNTSGQLYRELGLKEKVKDMTHEQIAHLLSTEGMLVKRPVMICGDRVSFGANETILEEVWLT
ncbi:MULTISPECIES: Spx/MgsR family RNA polymerase-binding regulatory protein [unclassified Granulicatella]|uniref:Spx/MgsR family RNA polymerase-binding regulatory protein n=1 Tax=unclassified Granulicatella TaxID=2630493 RepID=UPI001073D455|nr:MULTISPECIES: Spx/MgsR family RNA polymerase-binding regulatory protein [unclassified Granulicatella]MBF0779948.1 Spx/MgsR family RNA polymerase-binding regulatory protein [Granulicatella sp. 19428wC4_WM01]TFU95964.1 Spx/MgsR family RNA polymerase-binding regulatory protein [Granulicatella sp. WM01]